MESASRSSRSGSCADLATRRQFLKVGLAAGAVLAAVRFLERSEAAPAPNHRVLDSTAVVTVAAFVPIVLEGTLPEEPQARARAIRETVEGFDRAVSGLSLPVQKEVDQLFGVLRFAPTRLAFTGLWQPVEESSPEEVAAFLLRWRHSSFDIQRAGYQALTQLIQAAWFDNPLSWPAIGYPGPPRIA
jgi:hypothetical protein